jgi:hypothetical protein
MQGMRATMKSFQFQSTPLQESSQKMRYIMPFGAGMQQSHLHFLAAVPGSSQVSFHLYAAS